MKLKMLSLLFAVGALVSACSDDDDNGTGPANSGRVRVVHLSPDAPNVDVLVDGVVVANDVPYLTASEYLEVGAGSRAVLIRATGGTSAVLVEDVTVADGSDYTVLVGDRLATITLEALLDDNDQPGAGNAKVRLIHGAPGAGTVDIYVTPPGADISLETPTLTGVDFGIVSPYLEVPAGEYQVQVTPAGTLDVVIDSGTLTLSSGEVRTGIAVDAPGGGGPFDALILSDVN
jgi:hypothetical protein